MKVLIYEHYDSAIHGNQRYLMLLLDRAKQLYGDDLDITLVVPNEDVLYRAAKDRGRVLALNRRSHPGRTLALWKHLRSLRPDIVVLNNEVSFLSALPAAMLLRRKMIWHVKNLGRSDWSDALCFLFARRVLAIAPPSIEIKNPHLTRRFKNKIFMQPIGTRLDDFLNVPAASADSEGVRALVLTFLSPDKGADVLVDALAKLDARGVRVQVRIAGVTVAGSEQWVRDLKQRAASFKHVQVDWLGWRDDVLALLEWCEILVHPSRKDGVPRAVLEAVACGRPVIATRVGGIVELIRDGREGYVIPSGDVDALADRIEKLAGDPDLRAKMGEAGRERARAEFDIDRHVERLKQHLEAVVAGS